MPVVTDETEPRMLLSLLERANQVAAAASFDDLLERLLELAVELTGAQAALYYVHDLQKDTLVCRSARGWQDDRIVLGRNVPTDQGRIGAAYHSGLPQLLDDLTLPQAGVDLQGLPLEPLPANMLCFPVYILERPVGVLQLFGFTNAHLDLLAFVSQRLAADIQRAATLEAAQQRNQRLDTLLAIFGQIGATLDRDQILHLMVDYAREVIDAEACSLFLVDPDRGDMYLHLASNINQELSLDEVRVPAGQGIIGHVIRTGETVLVPDVKKDERHYHGVDQAIGFSTRAILAVPLRSRKVILGGERGSISERVIGGFEAINKIYGTFDSEDAQLLNRLANQAATVLEIADLYADAQDLLLGVIQALAAAIDAKDPYTEGHSQRVSDFSVQIAQQLDLPPEMIHQVRVGSLLHDIGKIGVADHILSKPGRLSDEEYAVMKQHPSIGAKIMRQVRMLQRELPGIIEHHERLDGSGYPTRLNAEQISLYGRIVAVADVFDALTSDRPYRAAMSAEEAFRHLLEGAHTLFDARCIESLIQRYKMGLIKTQIEREQKAGSSDDNPSE
jgi:putative nucleotidyltransferase with HDIG domain